MSDMVEAFARDLAALRSRVRQLETGEYAAKTSRMILGTTELYFKGSKLIAKYDDGGTVRYKYLELSGTGVTWVHTTTEP